MNGRTGLTFMLGEEKQEETFVSRDSRLPCEGEACQVKVKGMRQAWVYGLWWV